MKKGMVGKMIAKGRNTSLQGRTGIIRLLVVTVLLLCVTTAAVFCAFDLVREAELDAIQKEALTELAEKKGTYDEKTIVLSDTTPERAKRLAREYDAALRISIDGKFATLTLKEDATIEKVYASKKARSHITEMSPDYYARTSELEDEEDEQEQEYTWQPKAPTYTVNDTMYDRQTYIDYLNIGNAWNETKGSGITVAVIDTGIDTDHPEFSGRISEYSYNASEDKIVKDYKLSDGSYDWSLVEDEQGHGTAVTGVIAASMNSDGVVGIAPDVSILVIKCESDSEGRFTRTSDLVFGLYYAIERDVNIVNMSFGAYSSENPFAEATRLAVDSDIICVAAAGNDATASLCYPAADENVIGVGALAENSMELAEYSNYGENINLVAPGTTYTTKIGGAYGSVNGTSLACPTVVGGLALYLSVNRYQEFTDVTERLYASCRDLGDLGCDWYYGYGAMDINALICEEVGAVTFNMLTDELDNTKQVFIRNHTLQSIPEPERSYAVFDGWYYDIDCTEELNLYADVWSSDLTLYASWANEDDGVPYTYVELDDGTIEIRSYTGKRRYITIPDMIDGKIVSSIGDFAFDGQNRLRSVTLPSGLTHIGLAAFRNCNNIISMSIPDGVTEIEESAYENNVRLSSVSFGNLSKLETVGDYAFGYCSKLMRFELPKKLKNINGTAFAGATGLKSFSVASENRYFKAVDGVLFNYTGSELAVYPAGKRAESYTVPTDTSVIGIWAFGYADLQTVNMSGVQNIKDYAFSYSFLESVVIPDSVISMGKYAFTNSYYLRTATIGNGLTEISKGAFAGTALEEVFIPKNIEVVGAEAFSKSAINKVTFAAESQLVEIGEKAFLLSGIEEISFPKSLISIGISAFEKNFSLSEVTFAEGSELIEIGSSAFSGIIITQIELPKSLITIGDGAFANNLLLSEVIFAEDGSLQNIGTNAFGGDMSLKSIDLPESLRYIGDYAFQNSGLDGDITVPKNVGYLGVGIFASCHSLENIYVDDANTTYIDISGVVYNRNKTVIVEYPAGNTRTSYSVKSGATKIGDAAFYGSWNLRNVTFPSGLVTVGESGFYACENMQSYRLPDSLTYIEAYAFAMNTSLRSLAIPDNVYQIRNYAFAYDYNLLSITFTYKSRLPRISYAAFAYTGITSFRVPASVFTMAQYAFEGCTDLTSITFAANSKLESISAYMFKGNENLQSITFENGSKLTSIQAHGFEGMNKLTTVNFGNAKLTNIDNYAFRYCESLQSLSIPEGVTYIGRFAFYGNKAMTELNIPESVEFIGRNAFYFAENLNVYFAAEKLPEYLQENWDNGIRGYYVGVLDVNETDEWKYATLKDGTIALVEYKGTATAVDLTALSFGTVTQIGGNAFARTAVTSVTLPDTLTSIQQYAFAYTKLNNISIPAGVSFIGKYAFYDTDITEVAFVGDSQIKNIEQYAFSKTAKLETVKLPSSLRQLGRYVFYGSGITSVDLSEYTLTEIPEHAFAGTKLTSVIIPDSVVLINHNAFRDCTQLSSVTFGKGENLQLMSNTFYNTGLQTVNIPENMTYIGEYSFVGLQSLTEFKVDADNPKYKAVDGLLYSKDGRKLISCPAGKTGTITLPQELEILGFGAFENSKLSDIRFNESSNILTFGYRCFYNADNITTLNVPESVVSFDYYAFAMCDNLTTVNFAGENKLKGIYEGAFYGCKNLRSITIPDSVVEISDYAFYGCKSLTDIPISETSVLMGIYDYAFAYCGFAELDLPGTLIDIGEYAFLGGNMTELTIPDENQYDLVIGIGAFADCNKLEEITVPFIGASFEDTRITWFGYIFGAGAYSTNSTYTPATLKSVTITEGMTFIGTGGFYGLANLESINAPNSVTVICDNAFGKTTAKYELKGEISLYRIDNKGNMQSAYFLDSTYFGKGISGSLVLPECVTSIRGSAFYGCSSLTSITIPDGVTSIEYETFYGCSSLTSITIPDGVTCIGEYAFSHCTGLTSITIPDSVTSIGDYAFSGCRELTSINIPDGVTSIEYETFYGCSSLTSITIPDGVTCIGEYAFSHCTGLTSITIPDSVTSIGDYAFSGCRELTSINIPDGVKSIGEGAFSGCRELTSITIPKTLISIEIYAFKYCYMLYEINNNSELPLTIGSSEYGGIASSAKLIINSEGTKTYKDGLNEDNYYYMETTDGFKFIYEGNEYKLIAYSGTEETVTLPKDINGNSYSIYRMKGVRNVIIPDGVTSIGNSAFYYCTSLTSITIPDTVTSIGVYAFYDCSGLTSIAIPESVESIGNGAFQSCQNLTSITIPNSVTSIEQSMFSYCSGLASITIPDKVTSIGDNAFAYCSSLESITIPDGVTSIGYGAFSWCNELTSVTIPDSVTTIGGNAFRGCGGFTSVTIPDSVTYIGGDAFANCSSLESITIPNGVKNIVYETFYCCRSLTSVTIPDSVTTIGGNAFYGCSSLTSITIPGSVTNITSEAFTGYYGKIIINESNNNYAQIDGIIYNKEITEIVYIPNYVEEITIPKTITALGSSFKNKATIKKIVIPETISTIGYYAFERCSGLTSITIPDGVTSIGGKAFDGCSGLTSIDIPDSVTSIGPQAFSDCSSLTSIDIPDGVTSIGYGTFYGCSSLTSITIPDKVTSIGSSAFFGCSSLTSITIPDIVTSIEYYTFSGCSSLTSITIPEGVTSIGEGAFSECRGLTSFTLPKAVKSIGEGGFSYCYNLHQIKNNSALPLTIGSSEYGEIALYARLIVNADGTKTYKEGLNEDNYFYIETSDGFRFICENNVYMLIAYIGTEETVTLPKDINGSSYRIYEMRGVRNAIIPDGVTSIGYSAFDGCGSLTSITIPDSVTRIESEAFCDCSSLTSITIPDSVTSIGSKAFDGTGYYNNADNWDNGALYIGKHLIKFDRDDIYPEIREGTIAVAELAFNNPEIIKISWDKMIYYSNIETLVLRNYNRVNSKPLTLKNVVIKKGVQINQYSFKDIYYNPITGITIYAEAAKEDVEWDHDYPNWNQGNKVYYGGEWIEVTFRGRDGNIINRDYRALSQIVRQPYMADIVDGEYTYVFVGWDTDGDGTADFVPATSTANIDAKAVYEKHKLGEWEIVKESTCTEDGLREKVCADCNEVVYSEIIPKIGHEQGKFVRTVAPTCTEQGYDVYTCLNCGDEYHSNFVEQTGHSYGEWIIEKAPGCTENGSRYHICTACSHRENEVVSAAGHSYIREIVKAPTCTEEGQSKYTCSVCNDIVYESIDKTAHSFEKKEISQELLQYLTENLEDFFYGIDGDKAYYFECTDCGHIRTSEEVMLSQSASTASTCVHVLGDWQVASEPTCISRGVEVRYCTECNKAIEARAFGETDPTNHEGETEVRGYVGATCETDGYTGDTYCLGCNAKIGNGEVIVSTGEHSYSDWTDAGNGKHVHTCEKCSLSEYEDHKFGSITVTAQPTETADGIGTHTCEVCEFVGSVAIPKLSTENGYTRTVAKEATEVEEGQVEWNHADYGKFLTSIPKLEPAPAELDELIKDEKGSYADGKVTISQKLNLTDIFSGNVKAFRGANEVTGYIATGDIVKLYDEGGNIIDTATAIVKGDVFADGNVTIIDAIQVRLYILGTALNDAQYLAADASGDTRVNILDFIQIRLYLLGLAEIK